MEHILTEQPSLPAEKSSASDFTKKASLTLSEKSTAESDRANPAVKLIRKMTRKLSALSMVSRKSSQSQQARDTDFRAKVEQLLRLLEPDQRLAGLSSFARAYGDADFCMRLLQKYGGDLRKSEDKLESALRWRESHEELLTTLKYQEASDLRVIGVEKDGRPILYQCWRNQLAPASAALDQYVVRMVEAIDLLPDGMETVTHIWDMHGMVLRLNLNPAPLVNLLGVLESYFAGRMHRLVIVDMPRMAGFLKDAIWPILPERTRNKIKFVSTKDAIAHVQDACDAAVSAQIQAVIQTNRDPSNTLEQRRRTWSQTELDAGLCV